MPAMTPRLQLAVAFAALAAAASQISGPALAGADAPLVAGSVTQGGGAAPAAATAQAAAQTGAQGASATQSATQGTPAAIAGDAMLEMRPRPDVDESALRYYAKLRNEKRVELETKRLKTLYPEWTVPDDLYAQGDQGPPDETPLWDLFSADRMEELQVVIAERKRVEPGWTPSRDLELKIRRKEARRKVIALWNEKKWKELVAYAQSDATVAEIGDVDVLWTLAEGFANAKQRPQALAIYVAILNTAQEAPERIGTMHKAIANLPMGDVETLVAMGKPGKDGGNEFDVILVDIARARISAYLHDERVEEVAAGDLAAFETFAKTAEDPNQPGLVAWYRYKRKDFKGSLEWFKIALAKGGDAMIAHGLAHALRELGYFRETEEVAYAWRQYLTNNRILFVDILERDLTREIPPYVETERLARYGRVAAEDASGEGAQALAWYAYNSCQYQTALEWFERAMAWMPKQETVYGYALTLRKLKMDRQFLEVVNRADGQHPKVVELLFPEERYRPPTPCEIASVEEARWWEAFLTQNPWVMQNNDAAKENAKPLPGRQGVAPIVRHGDGPYTAGFDGYVPNALHDPLGRYSWGVVTGPTGKTYPQWRPENSTFQPPTFNLIQLPTPQQFPLAVLAENPLRFAAQGAPTSQTPPAAAQRPAGPGAYAREPFAGPHPLLARRVPDVGPMPYERYGGVVLPNPEPGRPLGSEPAKPSLAEPGKMPVLRQSEAPSATRSAALANTSNEVTGSIKKRAPAQQVVAQQPAGPSAWPVTVGVRPGAQQFGAQPAYPAAPAGYAQPPVGYGQAPAGYAPAPGLAQIYAPPSPLIYGGAAPQPQVQPQPALNRQARRAPPPAAATPSLAYPVTVVAPLAQQAQQPYSSGPQQMAPTQAFYAPAPATSLLPMAAGGSVPGVPMPAPYMAAQPAGGYAAPQVPTPYLPQPVVPVVGAPPYGVQPAAAFGMQPPRQADPAWAQPATAYVAAPEQTAPRSVGPRHARRAAPIERAEPRRLRVGYAGSGVLSPSQSVAAGWRLLNAKRPSEALAAFERGLSGDARTAQDAAYGKSLALLQTDDARGAADAAAEGGLSGKRRQEIGVMALEQRIFSSYDKGDYQGALSLLRQRSAHAAETRDLTLMRAWSLYQLGQVDGAERLFRTLDRQMSTKQSRAGLAAIENKRTRMAY